MQQLGSPATVEVSTLQARSPLCDVSEKFVFFSSLKALRSSKSIVLQMAITDAHMRRGISQFSHFREEKITHQQWVVFRVVEVRMETCLYSPSTSVVPLSGLSVCLVPQV